MKHISIIGCGFVGKELSHLLSEAAVSFDAVVSSEESKQQLVEDQITTEALDLDKPKQRTELIDSLARKRVIYMVPPQKKGTEDERVKALLQAWRGKAFPEKVVYISTTAVYGNSDGEWVDESTPVNPKSERGKRRLDAEQSWSVWCSDNQIPLVILRVAGIYSPNRLPRKNIEEKKPLLREEQAGLSNRVHVTDLVRVCKQVLLNEFEGLLNVSDGHPTNMSNYFNCVADYLNLPRQPQISRKEAEKQLSSEMLSYLNDSRKISVEKLKRELQFEFLYPDLRAGLPPKGS